MRKTITNFLALAVSLLCLFVLGACPPEADSGGDDSSLSKNTEAVEVKNIPSTVNEKPTYKVYVQLSAGMNAAAGYVAKGEALIKDATRIGDTYTVTITELKDPNGSAWKGSNFGNVCVLIVPETVNSKEDTDAKVNMVSPSKTLALDWDKLLQGKGKLINDADYSKLYNDIVVTDDTIKGDKAKVEAK
jgi:hypothetical protein